MKAEEEQQLDWDKVERLPSGDINQHRYHVIVHYERVAEEDCKFAAVTETHMGNTIVENAEISIIRVDPDVPLEHCESLY